MKKSTEPAAKKAAKPAAKKAAKPAAKKAAKPAAKKASKPAAKKASKPAAKKATKPAAKKATKPAAKKATKRKVEEGNQERIQDTIRKTAIEILKKEQNGIRFTDLVKKIHDKTRKNKNTIGGSIYNLNELHDQLVFKPDRGIYKLKAYADVVPKDSKSKKSKINESEFYLPFAEWLVRELEECTKAIPLGGNTLGRQSQWGTPDVFGLRESNRFDTIKFLEEVVVAEIKTNSESLITAFGQACSYLLFAHKSYIVIPKKSDQADISRLDSLSRIFGIGLILFDNENVIDPNFEIRVRAVRSEPDMWHVNFNIEKIKDKLFSES
jgi:hypothetical protein